VLKPVEAPYQEYAEEQRFDVRGVFSFALRRWRMIAAFVVLVMVAAVVILSSLTPKYTAQTEIMLTPDNAKSSGAEQIVGDMLLDSSMIDSQVTLLQSYALLHRVVQQQNLTTVPYFADASPPSLLELVKGLIPGLGGASSGATPEEALPAGMSDLELRALSRLRKAVTVSRVGLTYVLQISVTLEDRFLAAKLANAIASAYLVDQLEARYDSAQRASQWLSERLVNLSNELRESEQAVADFRKQNNLVEVNTGTVTEQQLSELNVKLAAARVETAAAKAKYDQVQAVREKGESSEAIPDVLRSEVIAALRQQQAEVSGKEADLLARYGQRHPLVVNVRAEKADIQRAIAAETDRILVTLTRDYEVAVARQQSLEKDLAQLTGQSTVDDAVSVRLRELERVAEANRSLYEDFLSRAKLTGEYASFDAQDARVITAATPPSSPSSPRKTLGLAFAGVFGLLLGVGAAALVEILNTGFTSSGAVSQALGLPVLASVPQLKVKQVANLPPSSVQSLFKNNALPRMILDKPLSHFSEAIRALRAGVQMSDVDHPPKVVMITSSVPNEGKSTISLSMALSYASAGSRTILLDCDLRKSSTSRQLGLGGRPGIVELLVGSSGLEDVMTKDERSGLWVIPTGEHTQNPPDLLSSARMENLVRALAGRFDHVVIDSPPVGAVIDALMLVPIVDKVVYAVRWNATPRQLVIESLRKFSDTRKISGLVVSLVDEERAARYESYAAYGGKYYRQYKSYYAD